jgi:hypothetical protein
MFEGIGCCLCTQLGASCWHLNRTCIPAIAQHASLTQPGRCAFCRGEQQRPAPIRRQPCCSVPCCLQTYQPASLLPNLLILQVMAKEEDMRQDLDEPKTTGISLTLHAEEAAAGMAPMFAAAAAACGVQLSSAAAAAAATKAASPAAAAVSGAVSSAPCGVASAHNSTSTTSSASSSSSKSLPAQSTAVPPAHGDRSSPGQHQHPSSPCPSLLHLAAEMPPCCLPGPPGLTLPWLQLVSRYLQLEAGIWPEHHALTRAPGLHSMSETIQARMQQHHSAAGSGSAMGQQQERFDPSEPQGTLQRWRLHCSPWASLCRPSWQPCTAACSSAMLAVPASLWWPLPWSPR